MRALYNVTLVRLCLVVAVYASSWDECIAEDGTPRLHLATFAGSISPSMSAFLASAYSHAGGATILGQGLKASWSKAGFQTRLDVYRKYVFEFQEHEQDDIVIFVDAYDALVLHDSREIVRTFLALEAQYNRSLFMGAEVVCGDFRVCKLQDAHATSLNVHTPWRYLNGGLLAARVHQLRHMWRSPVNLAACTECAADQEWFAFYMLDHPDELMLDYQCSLFQNVLGVDNVLTGDWVAKHGQPPGALVLAKDDAGPVLVNTLTGTRPVMAHFPGMGKYVRQVPCVKDARRECVSSVFREIFRLVMPVEFEGTEMQRMQDAEDALWLPDLLRHSEGYSVGPGSLAETVERIKDRDFTITLLSWGLACAIVCALALLIRLQLSPSLASAAGLAWSAAAPSRPTPKGWRVIWIFGGLASMMFLGQLVMLLHLPGLDQAHMHMPRVELGALYRKASQLRGLAGLAALAPASRSSALRPERLVCKHKVLERSSRATSDASIVELVGAFGLNLGGGVAMHVLVTGGAGYIGSHMVLRLLEEGYGVTVVDNLSRGHLEAVRELQRQACALGGRMAFALVDLGDRARVSELLQASRPDWVMHFASLAFVGESMAKPLLYFQNVTENTLTLLTAMENAGVRRLIYSSSCSTYGEHTSEETPITEHTPQQPKSVYAQATMMSEQIIQTWAERGLNSCATILRYVNVIGSDAHGRLGEIPRLRGDDKDSRIANALFDAASGRISHFKVLGSDFPTKDGTAERDYVHVTDVVAAHLVALKQERPPAAASKCEVDIYNVGNGVPYSVHDLIAAVRSLPGARHFEVELLPRRAGDVASIFASPKKIASLGWTARFTNVTEALLTAWRYRLAHTRLFPGMDIGLDSSDTFGSEALLAMY